MKLNDTMRQILALPQSATPASGGGKPRIAFIDLAKGLCIVMVVFFHARVLTNDTPLLGALRMPLYFFLSGMFFKTYGGMFALAWRKFNRILVPFLFFYVIGELWFMGIINVFAEPVAKTYHYDLLRPLLEGAPHNYPIWFLVCLFFSNLIFCIYKLIFRRETLVALAVAATGLSGVWMAQNGIEHPAWLPSACTAMPFFYLGYAVRRGPWLYETWRPRLSLPLGAVFLAAAVACEIAGHASRLSLSHNQIVGHPVWAYVTSAAMIAAVLFLCKGIRRLPVISYMGRFSVIVLGLHMLLMSPVRVMLRDGDALTCNWVSAIVSTLLCLVMIGVCRKYVPRLTAQADLLPDGTAARISRLFRLIRPYLPQR